MAEKAPAKRKPRNSKKAAPDAAAPAPEFANQHLYDSIYQQVVDAGDLEANRQVYAKILQGINTDVAYKFVNPAFKKMAEEAPLETVQKALALFWYNQQLQEMAEMAEAVSGEAPPAEAPAAASADPSSVLKVVRDESPMPTSEQLYAEQLARLGILFPEVYMQIEAEVNEWEIEKLQRYYGLILEAKGGGVLVTPGIVSEENRQIAANVPRGIMFSEVTEMLYRLHPSVHPEGGGLVNEEMCLTLLSRLKTGPQVQTMLNALQMIGYTFYSKGGYQVDHLQHVEDSKKQKGKHVAVFACRQGTSRCRIDFIYRHYDIRPIGP